MKTFLMILSLMASMALIGCGGPVPCRVAHCPGVIDSGTENLARNTMVDDTNDREIVDDWYYIWLFDRPSMLTQWHPVAPR